jgi:hypothetical protein
MKVLRPLLILTALSASCAEKKDEEEDSILKATMPDGTEVELNKDQIYVESDCELDNVLTSTYRKTWYSVSGDQFSVWGLVFFNEACDLEQDYIVFGAPLVWTLQGFDGSKGTIDLGNDQVADYEITLSDEQLLLHPLFEADYAQDETFAKSESTFRPEKLFDFSLDVAQPILSDTNLSLDFTLALTTDDFLINGSSYLKSIYADISCKLANGSTARLSLPDSGKENRLDGAGTYSVSAALLNNQKGVALRSCEVFLERKVESSEAGSSGWEIKSVEITVD